MTKIVYNACYGGFGISEAGVRRYAEIKGIALFVEPASPIASSASQPIGWSRQKNARRRLYGLMPV